MRLALVAVMAAVAVLAGITLLASSDYLRPSPAAVPPSGSHAVVSQTPVPIASGDSEVPPGTEVLTLVEIFERSEPGVVRVSVEKFTGFGSDGIGSGFVFDKMGHIVTNAHVVSGATEIVVTLTNGMEYIAEVSGSDVFTDIAVIRIDAPSSQLHPLSLGDSSTLKVGEQVAAIGNPFGLSGSMTSGIVSQVGRMIQAPTSNFSIPEVIQTDAAINPGNSGGPLLNTRGSVVGINTAIQSLTGEFSGVGFAVPSQTVAKIVPKLITNGEYRHPWLGISGQDVNHDLVQLMDLPDTLGFLVIDVEPNSPASDAGLRGATDVGTHHGIEYPIGGDVIRAIDDNQVRKIDDVLIHLQRSKSVGDETVLDVLRDGSLVKVVVTLGERPTR